jgi:7-carboxy-7-deazaguanine synthase
LLLVNEIYPAILGESRASGQRCVIVRLTGCHRRCVYCDTAHAFSGGRRLSIAEVCAEVERHGSRTVLLTGGEPLLQREAPALMSSLLAAGRRVILETSGTTGTLGLGAVPAGVERVVDVKTPGSGLTGEDVDWEGLHLLGAGDEIKFVCCDRADYLWARDLIRDGARLPVGPCVTLSPCHGRLEPRALAEWILEDRLEVRMQVQLHRILWPERTRGT